jgi:AraC family transcriptional regulator
MKEQVQAVKRMQDYIKAHLFEEITSSDLANVAFYSPWHSYRLFREIMNMSPSDYIRRLRLSTSAIRLRDEKVKIIDVAYDCGFDSVDGFQRAFLKEFGTNPKEYAQNPVPISLFIPFDIVSVVEFNEKYSASEESDFKEKKMSNEKTNVKSVFLQIIDKPEHKVLIKRGVKAEEYFDYCKEVGCDVWGILKSMKSLCGEPVCLWLPEKYIKPNTSKYVQGVEVPVDYDGVIPEGFDVITLSAAKYLMFQSEPFAEEDYESAIENIWEAEKKYNPSAIGYKWDSENPRIQLEPIGERGYIELVPICK